MSTANGAVMLDDTREWLETDGRGGWASSTVSGVNTRRYHALLTAAVLPPQRRFVLLNALEETLELDGQALRFSCHRYAPNVIDPPGYRFLIGFRLDPWPVWRYAIGGALLEKALFLRHGTPATVVSYRLLRGPASLRLRVRLLGTGRDLHALHHENGAVQLASHGTSSRLTWSPYAGVPAIDLRHNAQAYRQAPLWYRRNYYTLDAARGLEAVEDYWSPGELVFTLAPDEGAWLVLSAGPLDEGAPQIGAWMQEERARRETLLRSIPQATDAVERLTLAADQFLVTARDGAPAIIAGYPGFGAWGRDTLIALPGLMLQTGRSAGARGLLAALARRISEGMVPDALPEAGGAPAYHSVDASLWFIVAVYQYWRTTESLDVVQEDVWKRMQAIIRAYWHGTRCGIQMSSDGLLRAGDAATPLTWMDARVNGQAVTPRHGQAVEIQALWINALWIMAELAARLGQPRRSAAFRIMAEHATASFRARFWCQRGGYLYDVIDGQTRDASVRPNQLLAVSLPFVCVTPTQARAIVETVERALLTPYGLRTLSPANPAYRPRYLGALQERDRASHQGTVWPWLLGPFVDAAVRVYGDGPAMRRRIAGWLDPLLRWVLAEGGGSLPECFDGEPPHAPRGAPAQAWSVAEVLRLCVTYRIGCAAEDVTRPAPVPHRPQPLAARAPAPDALMTSTERGVAVL